MITRFYNSTAILERYSVTTDEFGQEVKTWTMTTTIIGQKQSRTGNTSIVNTIDKIRTNERFYCNVVSLNANDRLLFSTKTFNFKGTVGSSSNLTSTDTGALYFSTSTFSTYVYGNYIRYNTTGYGIENFSYYKILYVNNLENVHMQIDIEEDNENRT